MPINTDNTHRVYVTLTREEYERVLQRVSEVKKALQEKFDDPEWKELISKGAAAGLALSNFTHSFCEILE